MSWKGQEQSSSLKPIVLSEDMTFKQLIGYLENLEVKVSVMEETLDSFSENMSMETMS